MPRWDGGCGCCSCIILNAMEMATSSHWNVVSGSWTASTGVLSGSGAIALTESQVTGAQYLKLSVTATQPSQILDILLGSDATASTVGVFIRITFGDSSDSDGGCGSMQAFYNGTALENAQPMMGLVEGSAMEVVITTDAVLSKLTAFVTGLYGNVTAVLPADISGRVGLRLYDDQSDTVTVEFVADESFPAPWKRLWIKGTTCQGYNVCGSVIDTWTFALPDPDTPLVPPDSTCIHTIGDPFTYDPPILGTTSVVGMGTVDVGTVVSEFDISRGYDQYATYYGFMTENDGYVVEVYADDDQHTVRVTRSPIYQVSSFWYYDTLLELVKEGSVVASSSTTHISEAGAFEVDGVYQAFDEYTLGIGFCSGTVIVWHGRLGGVYDYLSYVSDLIGGGSIHGGRFISGIGGFRTLATVRCGIFGSPEITNCRQCETCEDVERDRSWQVEISGGGSPWDGTHILSAPSPSVQATQCDSGLVIDGSHYVKVESVRDALHVNLKTNPVGPTHSTGYSAIPRTDCASVSDETVEITGTVTATALVTAL